MAEIIEPEVLDQELWASLLEWINSNEELPPQMKTEFIKKVSLLRIKAQSLFVEIQKRILTEVALDIEFESEFRREMRRNLPYMTALERTATLRTLADTNEDRLARLERQMAGFDLFSNIEFAVQTMSDTQVPFSISEKVKQLTPVKRRNILNIINEMKSQIELEEKESSGE